MAKVRLWHILVAVATIAVVAGMLLPIQEGKRTRPIRKMEAAIRYAGNRYFGEEVRKQAAGMKVVIVRSPDHVFTPDPSRPTGFASDEYRGFIDGLGDDIKYEEEVLEWLDDDYFDSAPGIKPLNWENFKVILDKYNQDGTLLVLLLGHPIDKTTPGAESLHKTVKCRIAMANSMMYNPPGFIWFYLDRFNRGLDLPKKLEDMSEKELFDFAYRIVYLDRETEIRDMNREQKD